MGFYAIAEISGWTGASAVLAAYALLSAGRIESRSRSYRWLNLAGALSLLLNTVCLAAYPSAVLNLIWAIVALVSSREPAQAPEPTGAVDGRKESAGSRRE